jgi:hypothetical protein
LPVGVGANHEYKGSLLRTQLFLAPASPAKWRADVILIQFYVDALAAKCVGQLQHSLAVLRHVVAVADENGDCVHITDIVVLD